MIDNRDLEILAILQEDARTSNAEIARRLGIAPSGVLERIRKLETRGVLLSTSARIDPEALGLGLLAFVFVQVDRKSEEKAGQLLARIPGVQEVHDIAGEDCFLVKVRCRSTRELGEILETGFGAVASVIRTRTTIVLGTLKETTDLPVPKPESAAEAAAEALGV